MQINPGGVLKPEEIVGRDALVAQISTRLDAQSLILVAERRIGKTHVLTKIESLNAPHRLVIKRDLEGVETVEEFVQAVFEDVSKHRGIADKLLSWGKQAGRFVVGGEYAVQGNSIKFPSIKPKQWKETLREGVAQAVQALGDTQLVFLWDELPLMLQNIAGTSGKVGAKIGNPVQAMAVLDVLRELRQTYKNQIRMVYTGSIGLHHVLAELKARGYTNAPINDMHTFEVPPLNTEDATALATSLLITNDIKIAAVTTANEVGQYIAQQVDGFAYYVHQVLTQLQKSPEVLADETTVDAVINAATCNDSQNIWELEHYRDRTQTYYGKDATLCMALLDTIAEHHKEANVPRLLRELSATHTTVSKDRWFELIELLRKDFYLISGIAPHSLRFKFKVVLAWWRSHRYISVRDDSGG